MQRVHCHFVQLLRPKVPTTRIIIKTSCVPSRLLECEASTGRMVSCPLVPTLSGLMTQQEPIFAVLKPRDRKSRVQHH